MGLLIEMPLKNSPLRYIQQSLAASTLIEALIALTLLVTISTFALLIFSNVNSSGINIAFKVRVYSDVGNVFYNSIKDKDYQETEYKYSRYTVMKRATYVDDRGKLLLLEVVAYFNNGREIIRKQRYVINPDYQEQSYDTYKR